MRLVILANHNALTNFARKILATIAICALIAIPLESPAAAEEFDPKALEFFEKNVRPVLVEHCQKCHGPEKQWSNFRVDSRAALLKGGDMGVGIVPGNPEESPLIRAVRQLEGEVSMPPKSKLTDRQIADLTEWVRLGAAFPEAATAKSKYRDPNHWAFQPVKDPPVPELRHSTEIESDLDRFVHTKLAAAGIAPAQMADRRTLIRRATFDLIGLPPAPEEVADFLADNRPGAFARVVNRLLASPAYGERWGRHWLDVVRYADSNGLDENIAHGNAWRYRDYVVDAFNRDKPFADFVREQLAGDLAPSTSVEQRREQLIATGFLSIGPKVLAEVDEQKMEMDIVDEQIDTLGKAFLGLTLGCARCHDHKFDPIQTEDYYALAGVFKSTKTMDSFTKIAKWHENTLPDTEAEVKLKAHQEVAAAKQAEIQKCVDEANAILKAAKPNEPLPEKPEPLYSAEAQAQLKKLREELAAIEKAAPELPAAMGVTEHQVVEVPIHVRGSHLQLGVMTHRHVPAVFTSLEAPSFTPQQSGRLELSNWLTNESHPLTYRVLVNRIWRWHFGKGLVRSPDNFGLLGEEPTHPELLDWLTCRFVEQGGSLKSLHRLIMLSHTYQQSSLASPDSVEKDPENRLWSRAEIRRLEAEPIRDALLAVGGALDRTMGGSLLEVKNREFFFDHTSKDKTKYTSNRRSIYLPIVRNHVYDVFQLLDYPDAALTTGDRATTTIAPQALLMLNSELVAEASSALANRVQKELPIAQNLTEQRIERLHQWAFGRPATEPEIKAGLQFIAEADQLLSASEPDDSKRSSLSWQAYCQTLLASNEFIYVR
jgi:mono/diheme cytochrome c family protein